MSNESNESLEDGLHGQLMRELGEDTDDIGKVRKLTADWRKRALHAEAVLRRIARAWRDAAAIIGPDVSEVFEEEPNEIGHHRRAAIDYVAGDGQRHRVTLADVIAARGEPRGIPGVFGEVTFEERAPPAPWVQMIRVGSVIPGSDNRDGKDIVLTCTLITDLVAQWHERGRRPLAVDRNYESLRSDRADGVPAVGWVVDVESRIDGLWGKLALVEGVTLAHPTWLVPAFNYNPNGRSYLTSAALTWEPRDKELQSIPGLRQPAEPAAPSPTVVIWTQIIRVGHAIEFPLSAREPIVVTREVIEALANRWRGTSGRPLLVYEGADSVPARPNVMGRIVGLDVRDDGLWGLMHVMPTGAAVIDGHRCWLTPALRFEQDALSGKNELALYAAHVTFRTDDKEQQPIQRGDAPCVG